MDYIKIYLALCAAVAVLWWVGILLHRFVLRDSIVERTVHGGGHIILFCVLAALGLPLVALL